MELSSNVTTKNMLKRRIIFFIFIFVFYYQHGFNQNNETEHRIAGTNIHYEPDDWITYSMTRWINSLAEGREYIYFGTDGGITRFNFYYNNWNRPYTISDVLLFFFKEKTAYEINTDYIWCSTHLGVSVYRMTWNRWENFFKDEFGLFPGDDIVSIGFDDQYVWLESRDGEVFKSDNQQVSFFRAANNTITNNQITWFGKKTTNLNDLPELFMQNGYFFDDKGIIKDYRLDDYYITCYTEDHWNNIWIGSWGVSAGKADSRIKILELMPYGLFINNVNAFEFDDDGNIWIGGIGSYNGQSGITYWDMGDNQIQYYQARFNNNIFSDQVTSIAIDKQHVWFGTEYGLIRYIPTKNEWKSFDTSFGLRDNFVLDVEVDEKNVWIGTLLGLNQIVKNDMNKKDFSIKDVADKDILNMKVFDIEIMNNLLWIGTEYGVYVYDTKEKKGGFEDEPDGPQNNEVTAVGIFEDKDVWCGMENGVEVYDVTSNKWLGVPKRRFYTTSYINYIVVDKAAAWLATKEGVLKFDKQRERWRKFNLEDGLPSDMVNYIVLDGDYIWFGTPNGLTRFYWNAPYRID